MLGGNHPPLWGKEERRVKFAPGGRGSVAFEGDHLWSFLSTGTGSPSWVSGAHRGQDSSGRGLAGLPNQETKTNVSVNGFTGSRRAVLHGSKERWEPREDWGKGFPRSPCFTVKAEEGVGIRGEEHMQGQRKYFRRGCLAASWDVTESTGCPQRRVWRQIFDGQLSPVTPLVFQSSTLASLANHGPV